MQRQESYVMNSPKLLIRLLPKPGVEWVGNVKIECQETGLRAELSYKGSSFFGFGGGRSIRGKIIDSSSLNTLYEIDGQWDRYIHHIYSFLITSHPFFLWNSPPKRTVIHAWLPIIFFDLSASSKLRYITMFS